MTSKSCEEAAVAKKLSGSPTKTSNRIINLGCPDRPLTTEDPSIEALLPTDDSEWDQGVRNHLLTLFELYNNPVQVMINRGPVTLSSPSSIMGRFARVALATHLLGRVLRNRSDRSMDLLFKREEASRLDRALHALLLYNDHYRQENCTIACCQTAVCYRYLSPLEALCDL